MEERHWTDRLKDLIAVKMIDSAAGEEVYINITFIAYLVYLNI